jgi:bacillithiol biosynthesis cysteine-adding enzyme BshC
VAGHEILTPEGIVRQSIPLDRLPWIRPLVSEYVYHFDAVSELFAGNPASPQAWRDAIASVGRGDRGREAIARIVANQLARRQAPDEAIAAAARLADPRAVAIVTGQQAGLFGGPLYTLLKAVTAVQLARTVEREHGVPAVPVFWVDAEDHDWDEVRSTLVLDADFSMREVALDAVDGAGSQPVGRLVLDAGAGDALEALRAALPTTEFSAGVLEALALHYRPGTRVGAAFAGWLETLLGRHGLVVFEGDDPAAKPLARDIFTREIAAPGRTAQLARAAGARMTALGHSPQVEPAEDAVSLFYLDAEGRTPIRRDGAPGFTIRHAGRDAASLGEEAEAHPERFSPNVLLRPLVQDRLFPTVCYVGGPSEIAYQAQLKDAYAAFDVPSPLLFPRAAATLLDSGAMRFLDRSGIRLEDLRGTDDSVLNRLLERLLPPSLERTLGETADEMATRAARIKEAVTSVDPTLAGAVDTTVEKIRATLHALHNKVVQASKKKDETLRRQFERTRTLAFPGGEPQERALGLVFFVNRYGPALCDRLLDGLPLDTGRHYLLTP